MLCESFTSWRRLHAVKDCRLKRFKHAPAAQNQVRTIIREIDASALAPEDIRLLDDLLDGYGANVRHIMDLLKTRRYRRFCHGNLYQEFRKTLRAEHRAMQEKLPEEERAAHPLALGGMQGKVWKVSVEYACALYDRYWRGIQVRALQELRRKPFYQALTRAEQYYVACLLKSTGGMFFDMLDGRVPKPPAFPKSIQGSVAHFREVSLTQEPCVQKCVPRCASLVATCRYTARTGRVFWRREKATIRCEKAPPGTRMGSASSLRSLEGRSRSESKGEAPSKRRSCLCVMVTAFFCTCLCRSRSSLWKKCPRLRLDTATARLLTWVSLKSLRTTAADSTEAGWASC